MFDFLQKLGAKAGPRAQQAIESAIINTPTIRKAVAEAEKDLAAERADLLKKLAAADQAEAKTMGDLAAKLQQFAADWVERKKELDEFSRQWQRAIAEAGGQQHGFHRQRYLLLRQLDELAPESVEQAAVELEGRWRAYAEAALMHPGHDFDKMRDRDTEFRNVVRAVRELKLVAADQIGAELAKLMQQAEKLLAAQPPQIIFVDAQAIGYSRSDDPNYASCSLPERQAGNWNR